MHDIIPQPVTIPPIPTNFLAATNRTTAPDTKGEIVDQVTLEQQPLAGLDRWVANASTPYQQETRQLVADKIQAAYTNRSPELNLTGLQFGSDLPHAIKELTWLKTLDISGSSVTQLPDNLLNHLSKLDTLGISRTQISEFPKFSDSSKLRILGAANTQISELPQNIDKQLPDLQILSLRNTPLSKLPDNMGNLSKLLYLDVSGTQIDTLPDSLDQLKRLEALSMAGTNLDTIPLAMTGLSALKYLDLAATSIISLQIRRAPTQTLRELNGGQPLPEDNAQLSQQIAQTYAIPSVSLLDYLPQLERINVSGTPFVTLLNQMGLAPLERTPIPNILDDQRGTAAPQQS